MLRGLFTPQARWLDVCGFSPVRLGSSASPRQSLQDGMGADRNMSAVWMLEAMKLGVMYISQRGTVSRVNNGLRE
jgi:hypothetical protein